MRNTHCVLFCFTVRSQDPKYADAIAEMMDRIKSGTALRSGNQKRRVGHLIYSIKLLVFLDLLFLWNGQLMIMISIFSRHLVTIRGVARLYPFVLLKMINYLFILVAS